MKKYNFWKKGRCKSKSVRSTFNQPFFTIQEERTFHARSILDKDKKLSLIQALLVLCSQMIITVNILEIMDSLK
jgi:hypothetical protein